MFGYKLLSIFVEKSTRNQVTGNELTRNLSEDFNEKSFRKINNESKVNIFLTYYRKLID